MTADAAGEEATSPGAQGLLAPPLAGGGRKEPPCRFQRVWPCHRWFGTLASRQ